jgi:hypothetical protein
MMLCECKSCGGRGFRVPEYDADEHNMIQAEIISGVWDCKPCNGSGYVEREVDGCICYANSWFECACGYHT